MPLLSTTDPLGRTTKYEWCTCGGLSKLTDPNGNATCWGLDLEGRVTSKTYADSSAIGYAYEANTTRLSTETDPTGSVATYTYNVDDTLQGVSYSAGTNVASTHSVGFTYDPVYNRVSTMADLTGTTTYNYNTVNGALGAGRLGSISVPIYGTGDSATVSYTTSGGAAGYDELGRVVSRGIDSANYVGTTYDALGRVTNVSNALGAFVYAYVDETNRLSGVTYPSGTNLSTSYGYFPSTDAQDFERLKCIKNMVGSTQLSKFDYTYNTVGTIATWTQQADSSTAVLNTLSYDAADQLTGDVQSGGATTTYGYGYDPAGNRLSGTVGSITTVGNFNGLNQLTSLSGSPVSQTVSGYTSGAATNVTVNAVPATITGGTNFTANVPLLPGSSNVVSVVAQPSSGSTTTQRYGITTTGAAPGSLAYDANGNCTTDENGNTYQWDALNRLTKITYPGNGGAYYTTMAYDGLSRRVQIVDNLASGTTTKNYLWIGSTMVEERDGSNNVTKRFLPQGEQQILSGTATPYYYTSDHLGSTREMLNSSGSIVARYGYDPNGNTTVVSGTILPTFGFAEMYWHQPSGEYFTKWRIYDPQTATWRSRDSLGEGADATLYSYCQNTPVNGVDPTGLIIIVRGPNGVGPGSPAFQQAVAKALAQLEKIPGIGQKVKDLEASKNVHVITEDNTMDPSDHNYRDHYPGPSIPSDKFL